MVNGKNNLDKGEAGPIALPLYSKNPIPKEGQTELR